MKPDGGVIWVCLRVVHPLTAYRGRYKRWGGMVDQERRNVWGMMLALLRMLLVVLFSRLPERVQSGLVLVC